jgi:hypothetical protein
MLPITIGTAEQFARAREALAVAGYTAEAVAARAGAKSIYEFKAIYEGRTVAIEITDALDVLIRLFMDSLPLEDAIVRRWLSAGTIEALQALSLLGHAGGEGGGWEAPVLLYPAEGLWIISDADANPARNPVEKMREDVVYPAIARNTGRFLA